MASYKLRDNEPFEVAMRKFKKKVDADNILQECRKRECYEKPSIHRKRAKAAAVKRHRRELQEERAKLLELRSGAKKKKDDKKRFVPVRYG